MIFMRCWCGAPQNECRTPRDCEAITELHRQMEDLDDLFDLLVFWFCIVMAVGIWVIGIVTWVTA